MPRLINALTVDVEDYFQVSAFEHAIPRAEWDRWECRVVENTRRLLALFDELHVTGTFFVLGWVAAKYPSLIEEIDDRGHEIGSHSYWHRLIYKMTPDEFRADLRQSKDAIEQIIGRPISLFRAPSFSVTAKSKWALDVLVEEGFEVDSSVFPVRHDRYGMRSAPCEPHVYNLRAGRLVEFPASTLSFAGGRLPVGGGGYFRLYPLSLTKWAISRAGQAGRPFMFYIHPWELDPQQPRVGNVGWRSKARHYVNLSRTEARLRALLGSAPFGTMSQALDQAAFNIAAGPSAATPALAGVDA